MLDRLSKRAIRNRQNESAQHFRGEPGLFVRYIGRLLNEVVRCEAARLGCETVHKNALT